MSYLIICLTRHSSPGLTKARPLYLYLGQFFLWSVLSASLVLVQGALSLAQSACEDQPGEAEQRSINAEFSQGSQESTTQQLAERFQIPESTIEDLRNTKQGWGEITVRLSMAEHLTNTNPEKFPTIQAALAEIGTLREQQKGWGHIARELGLNLVPY